MTLLSGFVKIKTTAEDEHPNCRRIFETIENPTTIVEADNKALYTKDIKQRLTEATA